MSAMIENIDTTKDTTEAERLEEAKLQRESHWFKCELEEETHGLSLCFSNKLRSRLTQVRGGFTVLAKYLQSKSIQTLDLDLSRQILDSSCKRIGAWDEATLNEFCNAWQHSQIETLNLSGNNLYAWNEARIKIFCNAWQHSQVQTLHLSNNRLGSWSKARLKVFCDEFRDSQVQTLNLSGNFLNAWDEVRVKIFCDALQDSPVQTLNLRDNHLNAWVGARFQFFIAAIEDHPTLTSITLEEDGLLGLTEERQQQVDKLLEHNLERAQTVCRILEEDIYMPQVLNQVVFEYMRRNNKQKNLSTLTGSSLPTPSNLQLKLNTDPTQDSGNMEMVGEKLETLEEAQDKKELFELAVLNGTDGLQLMGSPNLAKQFQSITSELNQLPSTGDLSNQQVTTTSKPALLLSNPTVAPSETGLKSKPTRWSRRELTKEEWDTVLSMDWEQSPTSTGKERTKGSMTNKGADAFKEKLVIAGIDINHMTTEGDIRRETIG